MLRLARALEITRAAKTLAGRLPNLIILVPRDELGLAAIDHFLLSSAGSTTFLIGANGCRISFF